MNTLWAKLIEQLPNSFQGKLLEVSPINGGDINQTYCLKLSSGCFFVKLNSSNTESMFSAEAIGLKVMAESNTIRVPKPLMHGVFENQAYILMEWLEFGKPGSWLEFGQTLAEMHLVNEKEFGFEIDNTIGLTPQLNKKSTSWIDFYRECRLLPQYKWALNKGLNIGSSESLLANLEKFFGSYQPKPSLLHGDLWSGNTAFLSNGEPVIYDPATYYGDREADIALTELFSGFPSEFYDGYNLAYSLDSGYELRRNLYNLYHILNHFNLFGGSYGSQAKSMTQRLLSEVM